LMSALVFFAITLEWGAGGDPAFSVPLKLAPAGTPNPKPEDIVTLSDSFELHGPTTLRVELDTSVSNSWVAVASALVEEDNNQVREFVIQAEEWHGVSGGESWSEGSRKQTEYLGKLASGRYIMRFETQWGREGTIASGPTPMAKIHVTEGKRSPICCLGAGFLILLPLLIAFMRKASFEAKRWKNSDLMASME